MPSSALLSYKDGYQCLCVAHDSKILSESVRNPSFNFPMPPLGFEFLGAFAKKD
ncbi:hypothetical protein MKW98_013335 [Papaver atlanticum]|uniref:Uncharacterized protein n=1 Tax=Papaver atlanticum TaxID=357466 RepID=A0AAD4SSF8_9MAGN|nr:hypothetical protein MKW98_013335 [Papaver atlanticum]